MRYNMEESEIQKLLQIIYTNIEQKSVPPSVREIVALSDYRSTSTVHKKIKILEDLGYITYEKEKCRTLVLTDKALSILRTEENSKTVNDILELIKEKMVHNNASEPITLDSVYHFVETTL